VSFSVFPGEILSIIGENGAGKSTLMKIIAGIYSPSSGELFLDGKVFKPTSPSQSLDLGVRVIFQELTGLENLSIGANLFLGREPRKGFLVDEKEIEARSLSILSRLGLRHSPQTLLSELSLAERQLVEIGRALTSEVRLLILDEPTSSLTLEETKNLLTLMRELRSEGVSILFISHRLDEVQEISDRVVGLRDGQFSGELHREEISHDSMIQLMVGRELSNERYVGKSATDVVALELKNFRTQRYPGSSVHFQLRKGEIVGMAGLVGAGRTELARAVFGVDAFGGEIILEGKQVKPSNPKSAIQLGIYLVPEDRRHCGLTVDSTVSENVTYPNLRDLNGWILSAGKELAYSQSAISEFGIKTSAPDVKASTLSGGNQQKIVLARWLKMGPKVLIVDEPTRGIDVGARAEIYAQLRELASEGISIWMISSDMEEVLRVSDRIVVMHEGRITGELKGSEATQEKVMELAVGGI
jgi:ribose transport system ATP-binding protein